METKEKCLHEICIKTEFGYECQVCGEYPEDEKDEAEETETVRCSICHEPFEREVDREGGRFISCPAHSFGEVREEDYKENK